MPATARLDIISDAICPWCWIGKRQLERALPRLKGQGIRLDVHWRPFQLNPAMPREGMARDEYRAAKFGSAARGAELDAQVAKAGEAVGLKFRHDLMRRTPNTIDAHRLIARAGEQGGQEKIVEALFRAYFQQGQDIGSRAVLAEIAAEAGMDRDETEAFLAGDALEAEVREEDAAARRAGLQGVPSFALDGHILFSGAVPGETMAEAVQAALKVLRRSA